MIISYCSGLNEETAHSLEARGARLLSPESQISAGSISQLRIAIALFAFSMGTYLCKLCKQSRSRYHSP